MMGKDFDWEWALLLGAVLGLAFCAVADAVQISKLQADVAFLRDVARETDAARNDHV
jgi:hypothetical protein